MPFFNVLELNKKHPLNLILKASFTFHCLATESDHDKQIAFPQSPIKF